MWKKLILWYNRVTLYDLIGVASFMGIAVGCAGLTYHFSMRRKIRKSDYFKLAIRKLDQNQVACDLLGKPIQIGDIDIADRSTIINNSVAEFKIPVDGQKNKGSLVVFSEKSADESVWQINRLELILDKFTDKRFIVFKNEPNIKVES